MLRLSILLINILSYLPISWSLLVKDTKNMTVVAEFDAVDYLWDDDHSKTKYELQGLYVERNNAIAGVKVDSNGNIYVTVPRWRSGVPATLNKLVQKDDGSYVLSPWPSWDFQTIGESGKLQNCQSMAIDSQGNMWIIETGRRNFFDAISSHTVNGPTGFYKVNIETQELLQTYYFPEDVVSYDDSFLNDIALDEANGYAYFSNAIDNGGIVVYNVNTQESRMFTGLSTQRNSSYDFCVDGDCYGTDGAVGTTPSDGIVISSDGSRLYWSPVQGQGLYMIETKYLQDFSLSNDEIQQNVVLLGFKAGPSDGMLMVGNTLYFGLINESGVGYIENIDSYTTSMSLTEDKTIVAVESSDDLRWVDTFASNGITGSSSSIYATSNKLDLFFTFKLDFSGKDGANFRVSRIDL